MYKKLKIHVILFKNWKYVFKLVYQRDPSHLLLFFHLNPLPLSHSHSLQRGPTALYHVILFVSSNFKHRSLPKSVPLHIPCGFSCPFIRRNQNDASPSANKIIHKFRYNYFSSHIVINGFSSYELATFFFFY